MWYSARDMQRAVIFDMDGVLVDSEPIYREAARLEAADLGFTLTDADLDRFTGLAAERMWSELRGRFGLTEPIPALIEREVDRFLALIAGRELHPMPGIPEFLTRLRQAGIPVAVASSSRRRVVERVIARLGLADILRVRIAGEDVTAGKPAPDIFLQAAARLGIPPAACFVVEDSANGVRAAGAAGMRCIGFRNPNSGNQDLTGADPIIRRIDPAGLLRLIVGHDDGQAPVVPGSSPPVGDGSPAR